MTNADEMDILRKLQLVETEILVKTAEICDRHNIKYMLSCGTLLGAVRHGGFIPWDDDIDIEMPIKDYKRFLSIAQSELGDNYFVQTYLTDPNYHFAYARIRKNNTTMLKPYNRHHKVHHGVWMDIFPVVSINTGLSLKMTKKWLKLCNMMQIQECVETHKEEFSKLLGPMGMGAMTVLSGIPMKTRQKLHHSMLNVVFNRNPEKYSHMTYVWGNITRALPKDIYDGELSEVMFEGHMFKAPPDYKRYLEVVFGNYMELPPVEERHGHGNDIIIDLENSYEKYMLD